MEERERGKNVIMGKRYWIQTGWPRWSDTGKIIIKIKKIGDVIPQRIEGDVLFLATGKIIQTSDIDTNSNLTIFTYEIGEEVTENELKYQKEKLIGKIDQFFK